MSRLGLHWIRTHILDEATGRAEVAFVAESSSGKEFIKLKVRARRTEAGTWAVDLDHAIAEAYRWLATRSVESLHGVRAGQHRSRTRATQTKEESAAVYQEEYDRLLAEHPTWGRCKLADAVVNTVAERFHGFRCSRSTVLRNTKDPRKKP